MTSSEPMPGAGDETGLVPSPVSASVPALTPLNPATVYLARLAPGSRRAMGQSLGIVARILSGGRWDALTCPWGRVRYEHAQAVRAVLAERYAPLTANRHLAALRMVLAEAWRLGAMTAEEYHRAADVSAVKGTRLPAGRELKPDEIRALFRACEENRTASGARDAAMLAILYAGGLRRAEAVGLEVADYEGETGTLKVRSGKGNKARVVFLARGAVRAIDAWLEWRGRGGGALLCPVRSSGKIAVRSFTPESAMYRLRWLAKRAGVASFTPHDLRRTFISRLLGAGVDISTVQRLAGHADVTTTARYDRRGDEAKREAVERLDVPYEGSRAPEGLAHGKVGATG